MARTKAVPGSGARFSDYLSASLLARLVPAKQVHVVLDEHGGNTGARQGSCRFSHAAFC